MRINIPNNKRHFVVAEEVRDRCVVTSAATVTWRNVDVVDVQLLAIGHYNRVVTVVGRDTMQIICLESDFRPITTDE